MRARSPARFTASSAWRLPRGVLVCAFVIVFVLAAAVGCACDSQPAPDGGPRLDGGRDAGPPRTILHTVPETVVRNLPCLADEAVVLRTENDVPHVYARTRAEASCVLGFIMAQDRFFQMDLTRRLSQGRLSELLGDAALATDIEQRMHGGAFVADLFLAGLSAEEAEEIDAFAAGINAYIATVRAGRLRPPSELVTAAGFLGAARPADLMHDWVRRDVVATGSTVLYGTSFETGDVGRARDRARAEASVGAAAPDRDLRLAGLRDEIMNRIAPPNDSSSAGGWGLETAAGPSPARFAPRPAVTAIPGAARAPSPPLDLLDRLTRHLEHIEHMTPRAAGEGYGSNVWAVSAAGTGDGHSLLSSDAHLQLSSPPLFWQFGLDTAFLGDPVTGDTMVGATIAGLPLMGVGTNGRVAWGQTAYFADVTDWYAEVIVLGADGRPASSMFGGTARPLVAVPEPYVVADVPLLMSVGRTEMLDRFTTFDGRWITAIEGTPVAMGVTPPAAAVNLFGEWIVPGDTDGDGVVSGVSFDYVPFDGGTLLRAFRLFTEADTVEDFRQAMRHFIGYGGSMMASDSSGDVLYSAYHAVPERDHLPRNPDGSWVDGADPRLLIDGTTYGGFTIPLTADGRVDEAAAAAGAPNEHVVPESDWPEALSPARGFVHHANNDPAGIATDGDLFDDPHYIGGPWIEGYRAERIEARLTEMVADGTATLEAMQALQADHRSNLAAAFLGTLLSELDYAQALAAPAVGSSDARTRALYDADAAALDDVEARLRAWEAAGLRTPSGVETFYSTPTAADAADSVATTIFHVWFSRYVRAVLDDEGFGSSMTFAVTGDTFRMATIDRLLRGRAATNVEGLGSYDPVRGESVFFDDVTTPDVETSHEIALLALTDTLAFLRSAGTAPGEGGFGSSDPDDWIWGLRHGVRFESLLADFLGGDPMFAFLLDMFSITPDDLPLAPAITAGDPRFGLTFFPRPGDQFDVDAANPGLSGERFTHGSGPVFRMVIRLGPDGVRGQNVIPGGQSGIVNSDYFSDQTRLWLGNETIPMRFTPEEVVAGATARETFLPE